MLNCFQKYFLIIIFLGLIPPIHTMENSQYRWPFNAIAGLWSKLPSIPPILWGYKIRKEANRNIDIINAELLNILKTISENGFTNENTSRIKILLACGADINIRAEENKTLLHLAALYQNEELFAYLQNQKADDTIRDKNGNTPIDIKNANEKLENILKTWPNLQEQEKPTEIINCIKQGANRNFIKIREKKEIIPLLHWTNEMMVSLLHWAVSHKQNTLVECLLLHGANPDIRDNQERTLLEVLFTSASFPINFNNNEMEIFKSLLQHNTDITIKFSDDSNSLRYAIIFRAFEIAKMLIEHGSDVTKMDTDLGLLMHAMMGKCPISIVEMLCKAGILLPDTILHCIANGDMDILYPDILQPQPNEYIETILTSAHPPKVQEEEKKEIAYSTALTIWKLNIYTQKDPIFSKFSPEIKWHILSFALPKKCFYNSKGMLYKAIYPNNYRKLYILGKTEQRVAWLLKILQKQNEEGKTASHLLAETNHENANHKFLKMLNGTQIEENYEQFSKNFYKTNPQNNLVRKIYDSIYDDVNKQYLKNPDKPRN